jgi:hypothetical protein
MTGGIVPIRVAANSYTWSFYNPLLLCGFAGGYFPQSRKGQRKQISVAATLIRTLV